LIPKVINIVVWEKFVYRGRCYYVEKFYLADGTFQASAVPTTMLHPDFYNVLDGPTGHGVDVMNPYRAVTRAINSLRTHV
jgi:hypothetical protein